MLNVQVITVMRCDVTAIPQCRNSILFAAIILPGKCILHSGGNRMQNVLWNIIDPLGFGWNLDSLFSTSLWVSYDANPSEAGDEHFNGKKPICFSHVTEFTWEWKFEANRTEAREWTQQVLKSTHSRSSTCFVLLRERPHSECASCVSRGTWKQALVRWGKHYLYRVDIIIIPFNRWENRGRDKLCNWLELMRLMSIWTEIRTQVNWLRVQALNCWAVLLSRDRQL